MGGYSHKPYDQSPLLQFVDGYFHQDWRVDAESWTEVVGEYLRATDPEDIRSLLTDIDTLVAERDDPEVSRLLQAHLIDLDPAALGLDAWGWLQQLRNRLAAAL